MGQLVVARTYMAGIGRVSVRHIAFRFGVAVRIAGGIRLVVVVRLALDCQ